MLGPSLYIVRTTMGTGHAVLPSLLNKPCLGGCIIRKYLKYLLESNTFSVVSPWAFVIIIYCIINNILIIQYITVTVKSLSALLYIIPKFFISCEVFHYSVLISPSRVVSSKLVNFLLL